MVLIRGMYSFSFFDNNVSNDKRPRMSHELNSFHTNYDEEDVKHSKILKLKVVEVTKFFRK